MRTSTNAGTTTNPTFLTDWPTSSELMDRVRIGTLTHSLDTRIDRRCVLMEEYPHNCLWIVADADALRAFQAPRPARLSFVDADWRRELEVSGDLQAMDDRELLKDLWNEAAHRCFPKGPEIERLSLAQFKLRSARDTVVSDGRVQRVPVSGYMRRIAQLGGAWSRRPALVATPRFVHSLVDA